MSKARQTQRKMVKDFKEATEGAYVDVLDKSKYASVSLSINTLNVWLSFFSRLEKY